MKMTRVPPVLRGTPSPSHVNACERSYSANCRGVCTYIRTYTFLERASVKPWPWHNYYAMCTGLDVMCVYNDVRNYATHKCNIASYSLPSLHSLHMCTHTHTALWYCQRDQTRKIWSFHVRAWLVRNILSPRVIAQFVTRILTMRTTTVHVWRRRSARV